MQVVHSSAAPLFALSRNTAVTPQPTPGRATDSPGDKPPPDPSTAQATGHPSAGLSAPDLQILEQLKSRDREVRVHEAAHLAAAGGLATSGATYSYQSGPDGQQYAVGGEVGIDISPVPGNPLATVAKADVIRRAALAPAHPSGQDVMVAQAASDMAQKALTQWRSQAQGLQRYKDHSHPPRDANTLNVTA